jgi:toxin ParE1/3/4
MRRKVEFRPSAVADLTSLTLYIAGESGIARAEAFVSKIEKRCSTLGDFPFVGRERRDGIRTIGFERRVSIGYRIGDGVVEIVRVLYGGRDVDALL